MENMCVCVCVVVDGFRPPFLSISFGFSVLAVVAPVAVILNESIDKCKRVNGGASEQMLQTKRKENDEKSGD